ncbi:lysozyme [Aulosira sp. FACHB-615]|uniref:lysozyme n=1 Tax=Aulosira sp. FACHB-615 TaxID=2692777 RepID=UPI0016875125|nr:lysozyme [Aulosira sp. FACHB-615]MBD2492495.1 lysozyme [Aulosira sp. FACHB-615]
MPIPVPGIELIKEFEGCHLVAYPDPLSGGKPITIGWGCTKKLDGGEWKLGDRITQEQADQLLIHQLENDYLPKLQKIPHWDEMNDNQRGALLSFGYNLGASFYGGSNFQTITKALKNKEWDKLKTVIPMYCNPGSKVEKGLRRRREAEVNYLH